ncbi:MAG: MerR family transcriptional regulator [Desulfobacteraceae bacterium]
MAPNPRIKKLYRIGKVSQLTGVEPHVLRYWESVFGLLRPNRELSKQRWYRQSDIDLILEIKRLLHQEKYTLSGVKQWLAQGSPQARRTASSSPSAESKPASSGTQLTELLRLVCAELKAIQEILR